MTLPSSPLTPAAASEYSALRTTWGFGDLGQRTQLELRGADRLAFLHNLCTNHIKRLTPGEGCEAFVTNVQGKILGHIFVFCGSKSLIVETVPGQASMLLAHLDRYHIREKVEFADRSTEWAEILVAGPQAVARLQGMVSGEVPATLFAHRSGQFAGLTVWFRVTDVAGPGSLLLSVPRDAAESLRKELAAAGGVACHSESLETARLEAGTPWYGQDITSDNLPQEVNRTERAISFTKGCYLGQETVARIDALGHVNRLLTGLKLLGSTVPDPGGEFHVAGKAVARVTSVAYSPRLGAPLALAYVRREHAQPGTRLQGEAGDAEVVVLPVV